VYVAVIFWLTLIQVKAYSAMQYNNTYKAHKIDLSQFVLCTEVSLSWHIPILSLLIITHASLEMLNTNLTCVVMLYTDNSLAVLR